MAEICSQEEQQFSVNQRPQEMTLKSFLKRRLNSSSKGEKASSRGEERIYKLTVPSFINITPAMQETWVRSLGWEDPLEK